MPCESATLATEAPRALGQDLLFELGAVAPTGLGFGFGHGVHLRCLVDTIVAAHAFELKGGMTVRLPQASKKLPFVGQLKSMAPSHTGNGSSLLDHHKSKICEVVAAGMVIAVVMGFLLVR